MIGIDTNILVRFIMQDEAAQSRLATRFMSGLTPQAPGYVSVVTLAETSWVLSRTYRATRREIFGAIKLLLESNSVVVERASIVARTLTSYQDSKADFADLLIAESDRVAGCSETVTFDKVAAAHARMRLLR